MECVPCGKTFTGDACYKQHIESQKHKKRLIMLKSQNNALTSTSLTSHDRNMIADPKYKNMQCDVCGILFNSIESYQNHSVTQEHAEKILQNLKSQIDPNIVSSSDSCTAQEIHDRKAEYKFIDKTDLIFGKSEQNKKSSDLCTIEKMHDGKEGNEFIDETDLIFKEFEQNKKPQFVSFKSCDVCDKYFTGPEPYEQHLESAGHLKKVELQKMNNELSCEPCKKNFSGQVPYIQHMNSEVHKKKIKHLEFLKHVTEVDSSLGMHVLETEENNVKVNNNNSWHCSFCDVQCTGLIPYQQHLHGSTHIKNVNRAKLQNTATKNSIQQYTIDENNEMILSLPQSIKDDNDQMEIDDVLPGLEKKLRVMSTDKLTDSIKFFQPDENIDFDDYEPCCNISKTVI